MTVRSNLTVAEEQFCDAAYCSLLAGTASDSLEEARKEAEWAAYWETVFSLFDTLESSADRDAEVFGLK